MSDKFVRTHLPCPNCSSSDGYAERADGSGLCFVCGTPVTTESKSPAFSSSVSVGHTSGADKHTSFHRPERELVTYQSINETVRGLTPATLNYYGVRYEVADNGTVLSYVFPRPDGQILHRGVEQKEFWATGSKSDDALSLFGVDRFPPGGKAVTITEGYFDALAVFQIHGSKYPAVAVQSASSAKTECSAAFEYLNSFDKIYLAFDSDEPGQKAAEAVARLFDFNKVYLVKLDPTYKDANGYLQAGKADSFIQAWWNAKRFLPESIVSSLSDFNQIIDEDVAKPSIPYPFAKLQDMTYGMRGGEFVLVTAQEGIGKTEILRAIEYALLKDTKLNIGVLHLEESKARTLKGYVGQKLRSPIHLPEFSVSNEDVKKWLKEIAGDERLHLYSHFGSDDPDVILSTIRWMAGACQCKVVFLDHITMVVTGLLGDDERRALDYISTQLKMMAQSLGFTVVVVSHVNDEGLTRGSRNISKVCDLRIDLSRDIKAADEVMRNTTFLTISKNRFAGKTGPAGALQFDPNTFLLEQKIDELPF